MTSSFTDLTSQIAQCRAMKHSLEKLHVDLGHTDRNFGESLMKLELAQYPEEVRFFLTKAAFEVRDLAHELHHHLAVRHVDYIDDCERHLTAIANTWLGG